MLHRLFLYVLGVTALLGPMASQPQNGDGPLGDYKGVSPIRVEMANRLHISLSLTPSSQPSQMTVSGRGVYDKTRPPVELRGTYYTKQRRLSVFGEVRGMERSYSLTLDGTWAPGSNSFASKCVLNNVAANVKIDSEVFYLSPGSTDQPQVSVDLAPEKATPGQVVTGRGSVEISKATRPLKLRIKGAISFAVTDRAVYRWPSNTVITVDAPGNGRVPFDIGALGLTLPPGLEDPKLVVDVSTDSGTVTQAISLEHDEADASAHFAAVIPRGYGSEVGKPIELRIAYQVRNRSSNPLTSLITERVWVSREGQPKTELPHQTWQAEVLPGGLQLRDIEDPQKFQFTPDAPGRYRVDFQLGGIGVTVHNGFMTIDVSGTPTRQEQQSGLRGSIQLDRGSTTVSDPVVATLIYTLSGRSSAEVEELVELVGPAGTVVASSNKPRSLAQGEAETRRWVLNAAEPGAYRLRAKITGPDVTPMESETALTVKPREGAGSGKTTETKPPKVEGTYGLVKKEPGFAPSDGQEPYGVWTGSFGEGSFQCTWTATRDYQGTYTFKSNFSTPPSVLKPGEIVELTTTSQASRSSENQPYHGSGSKWYVEGAEVLEATGAFSGSASDGKFYSSGQGKTRFKVGTGGTIKLIAGHGQVFGTGIKSAVFIYQWNSPPTVDTGGNDDTDKPVVNPQTGLYPLGGDEEDEEGPLRAFLQPTSITLRAGEMSEIVNVHISNFRKRTEDRVEVIFPEKTDNWASLPGGIVVTGGDGSYWPPNMARPEHVDGYFFRARSNAPSGKRSISIIVRQRKAGEVRLTLDVTVIGKGSSVPPPSNASWAGAWSSNFDDMVLTQDGDKVNGWFGVDRYKVSGTVSGRVFTFKIFDGKDEFGSGKLTLGEDGKTFEGTLTVAGNDPMEWKGRRVG